MGLRLGQAHMGDPYPYNLTRNTKKFSFFIFLVFQCSPFLNNGGSYVLAFSFRICSDHILIFLYMIRSFMFIYRFLHLYQSL